MANWGLPLAAIADLKKDPEIISPKMTVGKIGLYQFFFLFTFILFYTLYSIMFLFNAIHEICSSCTTKKSTTIRMPLC